MSKRTAGRRFIVLIFIALIALVGGRLPRAAAQNNVDVPCPGQAITPPGPLTAVALGDIEEFNLVPEAGVTISNQVWTFTGPEGTSHTVPSVNVDVDWGSFTGNGNNAVWNSPLTGGSYTVTVSATRTCGQGGGGAGGVPPDTAFSVTWSATVPKPTVTFGPDLVIPLYGTGDLAVTITPPIADSTIAFDTSDPTVATCSYEGADVSVYGVGEGHATITAYYPDGSFAASAAVTVVDVDTLTATDGTDNGDSNTPITVPVGVPVSFNATAAPNEPWPDGYPQWQVDGAVEQYGDDTFSETFTETGTHTVSAVCGNSLNMTVNVVGIESVDAKGSYGTDIDAYDTSATPSIPGTLYVPVGATVDFTATPNGYEEFPDNQPVWSDGETGANATITYGAIGQSTVTATCGSDVVMIDVYVVSVVSFTGDSQFDLDGSQIVISPATLTMPVGLASFVATNNNGDYYWPDGLPEWEVNGVEQHTGSGFSYSFIEGSYTVTCICGDSQVSMTVNAIAVDDIEGYTLVDTGSVDNLTAFNFAGLTYPADQPVWTEYGPPGSTAALTMNTGGTTSLTPDVPGYYSVTATYGDSAFTLTIYAVANFAPDPPGDNPPANPPPTPPVACGTWAPVSWTTNPLVVWTPDGNGNPQPSPSPTNFTIVLAWSDPCAGTTQPNQIVQFPYVLKSDKTNEQPDGTYLRTVQYYAGCNVPGVDSSTINGWCVMPRHWDVGAAPITGNLAPASGTNVAPGATVHCADNLASDTDHFNVGTSTGILSVTASEPLLTYAWTAVDANGAAAGGFDNPSSKTPVWTAPTTAGAYTLNCAVGDSEQTPATPDTGTRNDTPATPNPNPITVNVVSTGFTQTPLYVPINGTGTLKATVTPASAANAVTFAATGDGATVTPGAVDTTAGTVILSVTGAGAPSTAGAGTTVTATLAGTGVGTGKIYSVNVDHLECSSNGSTWDTPATTDVYLAVGQSATVTAYDSPNGPWPDNKPVWGGSATAVGSGNGDTFMGTFNTAGDYALTAECENTVTMNIHVISVSLAPKPTNVLVSNSGTMTATVSPAADAAATAITYPIDDTSVATSTTGTANTTTGAMPLTIQGVTVGQTQVSAIVNGITLDTATVNVCSVTLLVRRHGPNPPPYNAAATVAAGGLAGQEEQADVQLKVADYTGAGVANVSVTAPTITAGGAGQAIHASVSGGTSATAADGTDTFTFKSSDRTEDVTVKDYQQPVTINQHWDDLLSNMKSEPPKPKLWTYQHYFTYGVPTAVAFTPKFLDTYAPSTSGSPNTYISISGHQISFSILSATVLVWTQTGYNAVTYSHNPSGEIVSATNPSAVLASFDPSQPAQDSGNGTYQSTFTVNADPCHREIVIEVTLNADDAEVYP